MELSENISQNLLYKLPPQTVCNIPTFEVVLRLRVVRAHYGCRLAPDHDEHPHPGLGLLLQQLPESEAGRVEL